MVVGRHGDDRRSGVWRLVMMVDSASMHSHSSAQSHRGGEEAGRAVPDEQLLLPRETEKRGAHSNPQLNRLQA